MICKIKTFKFINKFTLKLRKMGNMWSGETKDDDSNIPVDVHLKHELGQGQAPIDDEYIGILEDQK